MKKIETDVAVIGAGSAGLSAAYQAAHAGAKVLVIDENRLPGGQLFKQIHKFFGSRAHQAGTRGYVIGRALLERVEQTGAEVWLNSLVYGMEKDKSLGVIHSGQHYVVKAKKVIVATGAKENYMAFPGVMGAGAAQTMVNVNRVLPGQRILMLGSGNVGLIVSYQLMQAGAEVVAVVEGAPKIGGYGVHAGKIRRAGVPIYTSHTIKRVRGRDQVEAVEIVEVGPGFVPIPGTKKTFAVDTVCLAEGNMAGVSAAEALGLLPAAQAAEKKREIQQRLDTLRSGMFGERRRTAKEAQLKNMDEYRAKEVR